MDVSELPERLRRFIDVPFAAERIKIERAQEALRDLANSRVSPLPQRHRSVIARRHVRLTDIRRELQLAPDRVTIERGEEDARGETTGPP